MSIVVLSFLGIYTLGTYSDYVRYGSFSTSSLWVPTAIIFVGILFLIYFLNCKIVIDSNNFHIAGVHVFDSQGPRKSRIADINLTQIKSIVINDIGTIDKTNEKLNEQAINNAVNYFKSVLIPQSFGGIPFFLPAWFALKYSPTMVIISSDTTKSFVFSIKPFSRKGVRKILDQLEAHGISIETKKEWKLE